MTWHFEGRHLDWMAWRKAMGLSFGAELYARWLRQRGLPPEAP
jgi:hypothetical protein